MVTDLNSLAATQFITLGVGCSDFCLQRDGSYGLKKVYTGFVMIVEDLYPTYTL